MALTDYERYQLEWMIAHGHSLGELMRELDKVDLAGLDGLDTAFWIWEQDYGFGGEVYSCEEEWRDAEGKELQEGGGITKDMVRAGIEHGIIRFEANPDPNDPWKTMCCVGEDGGLFYFADTTDIPVADYIRMNRNNLDMVVDDVWEALNGDILRDFADDYERYAAILREMRVSDYRKDPVEVGISLKSEAAQARAASTAMDERTTRRNGPERD